MAGLYIHIPFCGQKCAYCDFYSRRADAGNVAGFLSALKREMEARRQFFTGESGGDRCGDGNDRTDSNMRLDTIYIGGGTPSLLPAEQLQGLLDHAAVLWDCSAVREVTAEANPEDLTDDYIARLRDGRKGSTDSANTGFNRLSVGIQSFDDEMLRLMNRRHSAARAKDAVKSAQRAGFDNISIDLIYGIPGMTRRQWERTLDEAVNLGVQHISAYHLTIEPGTAFGRRAKTDEGSISPSAFKLVPESESEWQYEALRRRLSDAGFEQYEISNFALPGRRAVHNSAYWNGEPYLGLGPSAHSFDGSRRREWVAADIEKYIVEAGSDSTYDGEILTDTDLFNETVMTSLRKTEGLDMDETERRFGKERTERLLRRAERFVGNGSLVREQDCANTLRFPPEKFMLSDYVISELFEW